MERVHDNWHELDSDNGSNWETVVMAQHFPLNGHGNLAVQESLTTLFDDLTLMISEQIRMENTDES